jgi:hypothetical protein
MKRLFRVSQSSSCHICDMCSLCVSGLHLDPWWKPHEYAYRRRADFIDQQQMLKVESEYSSVRQIWMCGASSSCGQGDTVNSSAE